MAFALSLLPGTRTVNVLILTGLDSCVASLGDGNFNMSKSSGSNQTVSLPKLLTPLKKGILIS